VAPSRVPRDTHAIEQNVVLGNGANIKSGRAEDVGDCCLQCQGNSKCMAFAYHPDTKVCWLHSAVLPYEVSPGTISGVVNGSIPPLPPPPPPPSPMGVPSGPDACSPGTNGTKFPFCDASKTMNQRLDVRSRLSEPQSFPYGVAEFNSLIFHAYLAQLCLAGCRRCVRTHSEKTLSPSNSISQSL
jgi:hypothetical protein